MIFIAIYKNESSLWVKTYFLCDLLLMISRVGASVVLGLSD